MFRPPHAVRLCLLLALLARGVPGAEAEAKPQQRLGVIPFAVQNADPALADAFARRLGDALADLSEGEVLPLERTGGLLAQAGLCPQERRATTVQACRDLGKRLGLDLVVHAGLWGHDTRNLLTLRAVNVDTGLSEVEITYLAKTSQDLMARAESIAKALPGARHDPTAPHAAKDADRTPEEMLAEGKKLQAERQWGKALHNYQMVRLTSVADDELEARIKQCYARLVLDLRHKNDEYVKSVKGMSLAQGLRVLKPLLGRMEKYYVTKPVAASVMAASAEQIVMLTESESAQKRYPVLRDTGTRERLAAAARALEAEPFPADEGFPVSRMVQAVQARLLEGHGVDLPPGVILSEVIFGVMGSLDKYSLYLPPDSLKELEIQTTGRFCGIGAEVSVRGQLLTIVTPLCNSPAAKSGLMPGDRVVLIDGEWGPPELTLEQAVKRLRGRWKVPVDLVVVTEGETFPVNRRVVRNFIPVASVRESMVLPGGHPFGYVRLVSFRQQTAKDLTRAVADLERQGIQGLVLDLRGNPGGLLTAAVKVSDLFIPKGLIVSTRGRIPQSTREYSAHGSATHASYPVAVLLDGRSASASEIVAGAIRDHKRGPLIGTKTVGKGSVQAMFRFKDEGSRRTLAGANLTIARYYPPCGQSFDGKGIVPDIVVDLKPSSIRKIVSRRARRWILKNVPGYKSKLAIWYRRIEEDAKETDPEIDAQLAMAIRALERTLETGSWEGLHTTQSEAVQQ